MGRVGDKNMPKREAVLALKLQALRVYIEDKLRLKRGAAKIQTAIVVQSQE